MYQALELLFWVSLLGLFYTYVGYPALVMLASQSRAKRIKSMTVVDQVSDDALPEITVLIAAHNAERHIGERIKNVLACDYPADKVRVLVASDASSDGTVAAVKQFEMPNVSVVSYWARRGKAATLADAVGRVTSAVVVFTDASNRFEKQALRQLAVHFQDPGVGLVTGKVSIVDEAGEPAESLYWRSEMMVRRSEAQLGIMLGASGAIYAIRRKMFVRPSQPVINDDLVLPMLVKLRHDCRFVYEETARAYVTSVGGIYGEFCRRCRIGTGAFQCLSVLGDLLHWRNRRQTLAFASHKLLRWFCPLLLLTTLVSNIALMSQPGYNLFLWLQASAYATAVAGLVAPNRGLPGRLARSASSFLFMNIALAIGFVRWLLNPRMVIWNPTPRPNWSRLEGVKNF